MFTCACATAQLIYDLRRLVVIGARAPGRAWAEHTKQAPGAFRADDCWPWPELHAIFFAIWAGSSCEEISTQFGLIWSQFGSQRNCENFLTSISARPVRDLPPPLVPELALACIPYFSDMQELWRLKNDLPAYLSTAAAWLSNVEIDRNDMADSGVVI